MARQAREVAIGGGGNRVNRYRMEEEKPLCLRILPPLKSLADAGEYCMFGTKIFIGGSDPQNPDKTQTWCLASREESEWAGREKVITTHDPLIDLIRSVMARRDAIQKRGEEAGKSKDEIKAATAAEQRFLKSNSISGKWSFYVVTRNGDYGILELNNPAKKDLFDIAKKYKTEHDDNNPFGIEHGIFWTFARTGNLFAGGKDKIEPYRKQVEHVIDGKKVLVEIIEEHNFTEEMEAIALKSLPDLNEEIERNTYPMEVHRQLADAKGDPIKVRDIMVAADKVKQDEMKRKAAEKAAAAGSSVRGPVDSEERSDVNPDEVLGSEDPFAKTVAPFAKSSVVVNEATTNTTTPTVQTAVAPPTPAADDEEAALMEQLAALKAKKAAPKAAETVPAKVAATPAPKAAAPEVVDPATMADEDFDAIFFKKKSA